MQKLLLLLILSCSLFAFADEDDTLSTQEIVSFDLGNKLDFRIDAEIPADWIYESWDIEDPWSGSIDNVLDFESSFVLLVDSMESNYVQPFNGKITSRFGWRKGRHHSGTDIDLVTGDHVVSAFDGVVRISKYLGGYGNVVIVRHYNGLETLYAHLSRREVKPGDKVKAGELLGLGGSTGRSTGSHLHFEVWYKGLKIDPEYFIDFSNASLTKESFMIEKDLFNHSNSTNPRYLKYSIRARR